jgi:hypothetical protein
MERDWFCVECSRGWDGVRCYRPMRRQLLHPGNQRCTTNRVEHSNSHRESTRHSPERLSLPLVVLHLLPAQLQVEVGRGCPCWTTPRGTRRLRQAVRVLAWWRVQLYWFSTVLEQGGILPFTCSLARFDQKLREQPVCRIERAIGRDRPPDRIAVSLLRA